MTEEPKQLEEVADTTEEQEVAELIEAESTEMPAEPEEIVWNDPPKVEPEKEIAEIEFISKVPPIKEEPLEVIAHDEIEQTLDYFGTKEQKAEIEPSIKDIEIAEAPVEETVEILVEEHIIEEPAIIEELHKNLPETLEKPEEISSPIPLDEKIIEEQNKEPLKPLEIQEKIQEIETTTTKPELTEYEVEVVEIQEKIEPIDAVEIEEDPEQHLLQKMEMASIDTEPFRRGPSNTLQVWQAKRKKNLHKILEDWCAEENIKLVWNAPDEYKLNKDILINGTFKNAIGILFSKGLDRAPEYILIEDMGYELRVEG